MAGSAPEGLQQNIPLIRVDNGATVADDYVPQSGSADGSIAVTPGANGTITTVTDISALTASATSLAAANTSRSAIIVQNLDAVNDVRIGDTNIAAASRFCYGR